MAENFSGRRELELREEKILSSRAALSSASRGRRESEELCDIRSLFQHDRDRIIHSKAFRRLKHKTQVFISPAGDHYRTRLTHTLEVSQISRTIARALNLNEDLTEAVSLGHDLGHTPFGHAGEEVLNRLTTSGFDHSQQSLRVVDLLEIRSAGTPGLNLSFEVRNGILHHTGSTLPATLEGQIVKIADRVAYINHDIDDSLRAGILTREDLPADCLELLGYTSSNRIDTMVRDIISSSQEGKRIRMSPEIKQATDSLRKFLFKNVYYDSLAKKEEDKAQRLVEELYKYFYQNTAKMPEEFSRRAEEGDHEQAVVDYIAGMTDRYAITQGQKLLLPTPWFFGYL